MKTALISFISAALTMLVLDAIWLSSMVPRFYNSQIGHLLGESPKMGPAVVFYFLFLGGLYFFVLGPSLQNGLSLAQVFVTGALFGLVTYGTYDLTNHATLKEWPVQVTVVDMIWGSLLTGTVSLVSVWVARFFGPTV